MRALLAAVFIFGLFATPSEGGMIVLNTSDSQFDPGVDNQGWWSDTFGASDGNTNYAAGVGSGGQVRNFFTFDLSKLDLSGQTLVSATLEAVRYEYISVDRTETIGFFDVSTDAAVLNDNNGLNAAIFNDLGTGTSYGSFDVAAYDFSLTETLVFSLNAAALKDIGAAAGGFFSIGGSLQSIDGPEEVVFLNSGGDGIQRLVLVTEPTAMPEPSSLLLLSTGAATLIMARRRRKQVS